MPGGPVGRKLKTFAFRPRPTWEKGDFENCFYDFARSGQVGWKVIGKFPRPVFNLCLPLKPSITVGPILFNPGLTRQWKKTTVHVN